MSISFGLDCNDFISVAHLLAQACVWVVDECISGYLSGRHMHCVSL